MSLIEKHSDAVWLKTASALRTDAAQHGADVPAVSSVAGVDSSASSSARDAGRSIASNAAASGTAKRGVNKNGAPLLGDSRDLFRPKPS
ncbi:MAG: hypothetical protein PUF51_07025, partial [Bifidobacteriaceae bacterium]|nr:hypothetical protein [Bifidobacteriaceae bacterium]